MAKILFSTLRPENSLELPVCSETLTLPVIKGTTTTTSAALFLLRDMSLSRVWTGCFEAASTSYPFFPI